MQPDPQSILYGRLAPKHANDLLLSDLDLFEYFEDFKGYCGSRTWAVKRLSFPQNHEWQSRLSQGTACSESGTVWEDARKVLANFSLCVNKDSVGLNAYDLLFNQNSNSDDQTALQIASRVDGKIHDYGFADKNKQLAVERLSLEKGKWFAFSVLQSKQTHAIYLSSDQKLLGWMTVNQ